MMPAMRFSDASHVDVAGFYARRPDVGFRYRWAGYVGVAGAAALQDPRALSALLVALVLVWLLAWYQIVGAAWRSSVVAAILACAVHLTVLACCHAPLARNLT